MVSLFLYTAGPWYREGTTYTGYPLFHAARLFPSFPEWLPPLLLQLAALPEYLSCCFKKTVNNF